MLAGGIKASTVLMRNFPSDSESFLETSRKLSQDEAVSLRQKLHWMPEKTSSKYLRTESPDVFKRIVMESTPALCRLETTQ